MKTDDSLIKGRNSKDKGYRGNERRQQEENRTKQAGPRVDFKARAAALKAEQNAEYARSSEERFKQSQAAKEALAQANKTQGARRKSLKKPLKLLNKLQQLLR